MTKGIEFYLDTSVIVSLLTGEPSVARVREWLGGEDAPSFLVSDWSETEIASALSLKRRTGQIPADDYAAALYEFRLFLLRSFEMLPVKKQHFEAAARYCEDCDLGLRSGDALHLAIAIDVGAEIVTLDKRFAFAAKELTGRGILL